MSSSPYDPYIPSGQNSQAGTPNLHGTPGLNNTPGLHGTPGFQGSPSFGNPQSPQGEDGRKTIHQEMDETMEVLKKNMELAGRRGENLDDLQDKTGRLADSAGEFRRGANKVRKDMWWKDMKMRIWLGVGIIVLLAIIIIPAVVTTRK